MIPNASQEPNPDMLKFKAGDEFAAYDLMPEEVREVLREAPFNVSAADMAHNRAVMEALSERGEGWLADQLATTYRRKVLPPALGGLEGPPVP